MRYRLYAKVVLATLLAATSMVAPAQAPVESPDEKLVSQIAKALTNDARAQYDLARMYEYGVGTPPDPKLAHFWYAKAAKQNFRPAVDKIANWDLEIQRQQEREQVERARKAEAAARIARERAAQQQLEADAAAKAARERAAQDAAAKAAKDKAAQEAAAKAAKEQAAQEAAAAKPKRQDAAPANPAPSARGKADAAAPRATAPTAGAEKNASEDKTEFSANPCKGPSAKFLSTCQ